jgi:hypothetical protein
MPPLPESLPASLPLVTFIKKTIHAAVIEQCRQLFFRQSMVKDYLACPQMALYRWVLNFDQSPPFFSTIMGSAGHYTAYTIHAARKYDYDYLEMLEILEAGFNRELTRIPLYPELPEGCVDVGEAFASKAPDYVKLLLGYQAHPRNREFHSTMHEQSWVLRIPTNAFDGEGNPEPDYLLTGQIDQAGFYDDGLFAIRDYKFRDNAFRPSRTQLDLDIQATTYCTALKYGVPACEHCRPKYELNDLFSATTHQQATLTYNGPCENCQKLIGTPKWPQRYANLFELIWMNDFEVWDSDKGEEFIPDKSRPKIRNPKGKGPPIYPRMPNPDFVQRKGTFKGVGFLQTVRPPGSLATLMSDVLRVCDEFRKGTFYRNPGTTCNFLCKFRDQCVKGLELEIEEASLANISAIGTDDPW